MLQKHTHRVSFKPSIDNDDQSPPSKRPALQNGEDKGDKQIMMAVAASAVHSPLAIERPSTFDWSIPGSLPNLLHHNSNPQQNNTKPHLPIDCNNAVVKEATSTDALDEGFVENIVDEISLWLHRSPCRRSEIRGRHTSRRRE